MYNYLFWIMDIKYKFKLINEYIYMYIFLKYLNDFDVIVFFKVCLIFVLYL